MLARLSPGCCERESHEKRGVGSLHGSKLSEEIMENRLCFLVCEHFKDELEAVLRAEHADHVTAAFFLPRCGQPPLDWSEVHELVSTNGIDKDVFLIGSSCLFHLPEPPPGIHLFRLLKLSQCFYALASPSLVDSYLRNNAYLVTPGWLVNWQQEIEKWGFDQEQARDFFNSTISRLVLLDTGINPRSHEYIRAFADFVDLPFEEVPVGLDYFRCLIARGVLEWRLEREQYAGNDGQTLADRRASDYAMSLDLLSHLSRASTEPEVMLAILGIFSMLFAPGELVYVPVMEGKPVEVAAFSSAPFDRDRLHEELQDFAGEYGWTRSGSGFLIRVIYRDETTGILKIDKIAFPQYREHYLNLALAISRVCGLAISDVQKYQKIEEHKDRLTNALDELEQAKNVAVQANSAKSDFLARMSHEIRTPMNAITGLTHLLLHSDMNEYQQHFADLIHNSAEFLLDLINDILDFSKIEAGKLELEHIDFCLETVIEECKSLLFLSAQKKGIDFLTIIEPDVPVFLKGDPVRLRQVIINLANNAIKFTEFGSVTIRVRLDKEHDQRAVLEFEVSDTGVGIPENILESIFSPFTQAEASTSRQYGGSGLGLSIARRLVQMMGGDITVTSRSGQGSIFYFKAVFEKQTDIPRKKKRKQKTRAELIVSRSATSALKIAARKKFLILLVEDNPVNQVVMLEEFKMEGWAAPLVAQNGLQAVDMAIKHCPDLILMDIQMPEMDGNQATRSIRKRGFTNPIIALSASVLKEEVEESMLAGATDYITKPVDFDRFFHKLLEYLPEKPNAGPQFQAEKAVIDDRFNYRIKESVPKPVKQVFLREIHKQLKILAAVTDEKTLEEKREQLTFIAHGYKGSARFFGLLDLEAMSSELEAGLKKNEPADELMPLVKKVRAIIERIRGENEQ